MSLRLCDERYEEIKVAVVNLFEKNDITCTPISGFEIATKMGIRMRAYSSYTPEHRADIFQICPDGCSCFRNGVPHIFFNDEKPYTRQNWTIVHEIAHICLNHSEQSELAEAEANFFTKFAVAPPVLIYRYNLTDVYDVMERFQVGYEVASHSLEHCRKWYWNHFGISAAEQKLCRLFNLAV